MHKQQQKYDFNYLLCLFSQHWAEYCIGLAKLPSDWDWMHKIQIWEVFTSPF